MDIQRMMTEEKAKLYKKWSPFLEGIADEYVAESTAMLLENEARYLTEAPAGATGVSDVQGLQKIMLPIVRRVFPNLIANNIVSVQPVAAPAGIIFYLKYQMGTERPGHEFTVPDYPEFSMYENTPGAMEGYNPFYSTDEIGPFKGTGTGVIDGAKVITSGVQPKFLTMWPKTPDSWFGTITVSVSGATQEVYTFAKESSGWVVRDANKLQVSTKFTVTEVTVADPDTTGPLVEGPGIQVTNTTGAAADIDVEAFYKTDMEYSKNIPEMRIQIASIPVTVKTRKLKAMWSQESEQDLKAYHGLSADAELTALVSNEMIAEIDREIISKCMTVAPQSSRHVYDWSAFVANNVTGNYLDSHLALMQKVTRASNEIFRKSKIGPANWMVVGTKVASYIEVLKGFIPNPVTDAMGMNIVKAGTYAGRYDIYKDPMFPDDKILMGHKSPQTPFGAGVVYSPYVTNLTPVIVGQDDFNPRRGFLARYGLTQVPYGDQLYSVITVKNLP